MLPVLAAAPPAARGLRGAARDDQRQRSRRADRLPRRGRASSAWRHRRPVPASTTARSRPAPTTRSRGRGRRRPAAHADRCAARAATCRRALPLPVARRAPILACGAELKNTFCVAKGGRAWVGHHIGDLENAARRCARSPRASSTSSACSRSRPRSSRTTCIPSTCRPSTRSSATASSSSACSTTTRTSPPASPSTGGRRPAVGAIFDGTGSAPTARSGAASCCSATSRDFERDGMLWPVPHAGRRRGDPRALAHGAASGSRRRSASRPAAGVARRARRRGRWDQVGGLAASGLASPLTSSAGRLFDAVSALCGICARSTTRGRRRSSSRRPATAVRGRARTRCPCCATSASCSTRA